jgi:DNA-binding NarL/FixJ family response regulator
MLINKFPLKDKEIKIATLLCNKGLTNKQIAYELHFSERHVRKIIADLKDHYGIKSVAQLGLFWMLDNIDNEVSDLGYLLKKIIL